MTVHKVLCPVDFSPCSNTAFQHAVDIARARGAKLVIAHVLSPPPTYISGYAGYGALPPYDPEPDPRLEELKVDASDIELERVHLVGIEGEVIVKYAEQEECDLIILGSHGYGGFKKFLLGSVSDYVMRHAKCPVVIIKDRESEAHPDTDKSEAVA